MPFRATTHRVLSGPRRAVRVSAGRAPQAGYHQERRQQAHAAALPGRLVRLQRGQPRPPRPRRRPPHGNARARACFRTCGAWQVLVVAWGSPPRCSCAACQCFAALAPRSTRERSPTPSPVVGACLGAAACLLPPPLLVFSYIGVWCCKGWHGGDAAPVDGLERLLQEEHH